MAKITPHAAFNVVRPDEVAECWDGVLAAGDLYERLWDCVASYTGPSPEVSEEPCYGIDCVADFWDRFSAAEQETLNQLAIRHDDEMLALTGRAPVGFDPFDI